MKVFKPKTEAWLTLLIVALPIAGLGIVGFIQDPSAWLIYLGVIAGAGVLLGYNATTRLILSSDEVALKRYGRTVWRTPLKGTQLVEGRGGQPPILPAYLLRRGGTEVGYILKVWFDEQAITQLRQAISR